MNDKNETAESLDTLGYVLLKLGNSENELKDSTGMFYEALKICPHKNNIARHLQDALAKAHPS